MGEHRVSSRPKLSGADAGLLEELFGGQVIT
jgi:hypothetical protein